MANDRIVLEFALKDVGDSIDNSNNNAKALKSTLESIQKMSNSPASKGKAAAFGGAMGSSEYDRARGTTGQTGASGRDFANQARGLDGLVRLYATYAANLFAVSAGFRALSDAMDTTNMIQGMNQLGAQSGLALGTLAKSFAATTDGAISMREAMEATVKGTTAGLSGKQLMQLGTVANSASKALGVNMSDAVSRLTRGITKLEPELLDELGIFTKVGKATEDYARSIGKTEAQLTDFEKRQAFANAVLKEGNDKFGAINLQANPYDKLTASLKDLAQNGLEKVNKLLVPLISGLASSPTALTAAIAYLGATIVKQALPAIGQYKEALKQGAEQAQTGSLQRAQMAKDAYEASKSKKESELDKAAEAAKQAKITAAGDLAAVRDSGFAKNSQAYKTMLKDADKVTQAELDHLKKLQDQYKNMGKMDVAQRYENAIAKIQASALAEKAYTKAVEETNKVLHSQGTIWTALGRSQIMAKRAQDIATQKTLVSNAGVNTETIGPLAAFSKLNQEVSKSDLGPIRAQWTRLTGAITIATTAAIGFVAATQTYIMIALAIVAAFKLLDTWISKNKEQLDKFNAAIDTNTTALKTYDDTLEAIKKKDASKIFGSDNLTAQANAVLGLNDALTGLRETYEKLVKVTESSAWDKFINAFSKGLGYDNETKFGQAAAANISKQVASMTNREDRNSAKDVVNKALGTAPGSGELNWAYAIAEKGPGAIKAIKAIEDALKKFGTEAANAASRSKEFDDALKQVRLSFRDFINSVVDKSPMTKLGNDLITVGVKMSGALKDPANSIANMIELLKDTTSLGIFNPDSVIQLQKLQPVLEQLNNKQGELKKNLAEAVQNEAKLKLSADTEKNKRGIFRDENAIIIANSKLAIERMNIAKLERKTSDVNAQIAKVMQNQVFADLNFQAFEKGANLVQQSIKNGFAQADIDLKKGILGSISGIIPGTAALEGSANARSIGLQQQLLNVQRDMIRASTMAMAAQNANTNAVELNTLAQQILANPNASAKEKSEFAGKMNSLTAMKELNTEFQGLQSGKDTSKFINNAVKAMKEFGAQRPEFNAQVQAMITEAQKFAGVNVEAAKLNKDKLLNSLNTELKRLDEQKAIQQSNMSVKKSDVELDNQRLSLLSSQNGFLTQEQLILQKGYQDTLAKQDLESSILDISNDRLKVQKAIAMYEGMGKLDAQETKDLETLKQGQVVLTNKEKVANAKLTGQLEQNGVNLLLAQNKLIADQEAKRLNILSIIQEANNLTANTSLELAKMQLDYEIKDLALNDQQIANRKYDLDLGTLRIEQTQKLAAIDLKYLQDKNRLQQAINNATPGSQAAKDAQDELNAITTRKDVEISSINQVLEAKKKALDQDAQYTERQKAYGKVFDDTFMGMTDVLIDFAKTGERSFKRLIDSMIEGLIRYEMQQQMMQAYAAAKPGLMNLIGSAFGFNSTALTNKLVNSGGPSLPGFSLEAKGGVYDTGLKTFAQGGMFTNSVVTEPTMFKFAKGTGLMGEAGPEAIMPLKRDNNGNLGVRGPGGGGNVDVVVNNYGNEKATTKETTDSRGNRRIEVIVGDMVASELSRPGSSVQQSLASNYGNRPTVARR